MGASVSAADTAVSLVDSAQTPIYSVVRGRYNPYFGDEAFKHPNIKRVPSIARICSDNGERTVHFEDGTSVSDVDHIILGTGFTWTLPFLPDLPLRNNRVPNLFLHVFYQHDPSLVVVGGVSRTKFHPPHFSSETPFFTIMQFTNKIPRLERASPSKSSNGKP